MGPEQELVERPFIAQLLACGWQHLAGTLDDPKSIQPRAHTYLIDALPWAHIAPGDKRFWQTPKEGGPLP